MLKSIIKFSLVGLGIASLGIASLYGIDWLRYRRSPEYQAYKEVERIKKEIADDPYGGDTPEETLRLFISALKAGDTALAAKYFVYDKQEEWKVDLAQIKDKGLLKEMVKDLEREKHSNKINDDYMTFSIVNDQNEIALTITLTRESNNKWKIRDL